jgi:hypothetical protein
VLADVTKDLEAIAVRQIQIEDHEVGLTPLEARDGVASGLGGLDLKPMPAKVRA